jgi:uncharacterized protein
MLLPIGRFFAACLLLCAVSAQAQVVISQAYVAGGEPGATYRSDFIELHNIGNTPINVTGWSVQYADADSTAWKRTLLNGSIPGGGYFLVPALSGGASGAELPLSDALPTFQMNAAAGKIALVKDQNLIFQSCITSPSLTIADFVGYGDADCGEYAPTSAPTPSTAIGRTSYGCTDINSNPRDFALIAPNPKNSQSAPQLCNPGSLPTLTISDASAPEGNGPDNTFSAVFYVTLNMPAPPGGVRFSVSTSNGTATAGASNNPATDYFTQNWGIVIPEGASSQSFVMPIIGDTLYEADETIFITVFDLEGAIAADNVSVYTILNDDLYPIEMTIAQVQGSGRTSAFVGQDVSVEGIVTAHRSNDGFFLQSATDDGNPTTSEGIFVSTVGAPPASAAIGNLVRVVGRVLEFTPSNDLSQLSATQIVAPTIQVLASGAPLPMPVVLTSANFGAASAVDTAEKHEAMRVSVARARVTEGSGATISEVDASATNNGEFFVVLPDVGRPFREPGIGVLDRVPIPADKNPPRFDTNPERLMIRSRGQPGTTAIDVDADAEITGLTGVLDYARATWALLPDPTAAIAISGGKQPRAVTDARADEITIASMNLRRFWDDVDDGNENFQLTPAAFDKRLSKVSAAICDYLKAPDILGVQEVEHLRALETLANRINSTCPRAPAYRAYLIPSANAGVRNIGFLISNRQLPNSANRVDVYRVEQIGQSATFSSPGLSISETLFERPPLRLSVAVNHPNGTRYPMWFYLNHFSPRDGIDSIATGSSGWATQSERTRARRAVQATFLKNDIRLQQQINPTERIVVLGDFNAFDFSDGYVDVMGTLKGNPAPANQVLTPTTSDLLVPFVSSSEIFADAAELYSSLVAGTARTLEHILVSQPIIAGASSIRVDFARINADFAASRYGNANSPVRVGERDPVRMSIAVPEFRSADLGITIDSTSPAAPRVGQPFSLTATVTNNGPNDAAFPGISLLVFGPRTTTIRYTVAGPDGWDCGPSSIPSGGFDTTAVCSTTNLSAGASASFTMSFVMPPEMANQTLQLAAAAITQTPDLISTNNVFTTPSISVIAEADLSVQWTGGNERPLYSGGQRDFLLSLHNLGPDPSFRASVTFTVDAPTGTVEFYATNWVCTPDDSSATVRTVCGYDYFFAPGPIEPSSETPFVVRVLAAPLSDADGLNLSATVSGPASDANSGNNRADLSMPLALTNANLSVQWTKVPAAPLRSGVSSVFSLMLRNAGPDPARRSSLIVTADAPLNDVAIEAPEGWFCTQDHSDVSRFAVECINHDREIPVGASIAFNLLVRAPLPDADGLNLTAQINTIGADADPANNSSARRVAVALANADLSAQWTRRPKGPYRAGDVGEFVLTLNNKDTDSAWSTSVTIAADVPFENVDFSTPTNWSCEGDPTSANFKINCRIETELAPKGRAPMNLLLRVIAPTRDKDKPKLKLSATIGSPYVHDRNPWNNTATRLESINDPVN